MEFFLCNCFIFFFRQIYNQKFILVQEEMSFKFIVEETQGSNLFHHMRILKWKIYSHRICLTICFTNSWIRSNNHNSWFEPNFIKINEEVFSLFKSLCKGNSIKIVIQHNALMWKLFHLNLTNFLIKKWRRIGICFISWNESSEVFSLHHLFDID